MPQLVECAGHPVSELRLSRPAIGNWMASLEVATDEELSGAVDITDDDVTYTGTVVRSAVVAETWRGEVVGGAGGLRTELAAKSYRQSKATVVLSDLLQELKETLDSASTRSVLGRQLAFWTRATKSGGAELSRLTDALGARWRVTEAGLIWVGIDTYPETPLDLDELDVDGQADAVILAPETIALGPGVTLDGRRVGRVEHYFSRDEPLRTRFWIES